MGGDILLCYHFSIIRKGGGIMLRDEFISLLLRHPELYEQLHQLLELQEPQLEDLPEQNQKD